MSNLPKAIFISGTDTSVGKTMATALLASCLKKNGVNVGVIKPFQTGIEVEEILDVEFIYSVLDEEFDIDEVCPCRLNEPLSPHNAAEIENYEVDIEKIIKHTNNYISKNEVTLIEGAGGLIVPIKGNYNIANLAYDLCCPLALVTRPGLGTINHTLLSIEYLKQMDIELLGLVINGFPTDKDLATVKNLDVFTDLYKLNFLGIIPQFNNEEFRIDDYKKLYENSPNYFTNKFGGKFDFYKFKSSL